MITALDGEPVRSDGDLLRLLGRYKVGDQVRLDVVRDGRKREVTVTLEAM